MTDLENAEIMNALGELAERVKRAYETNDADLYISAFDLDAIVSMPESRPVQGREALLTAFRNRPALPPGATFAVEPLEIEPLSSDWAYAFGKDILRFAGGTVRTMTFLVLIKRTPNGWKTFREVVSADQP
jgi:ketosteroid isomerase-like protein